MKERQFKILGIFVVLSFVLFNYQNCGSSKGAMNSTGDSNDPAQGATMNIIDPVLAGGINFAQSKAVVGASDTELSANGLCSQEQNGAFIGWQVIDEQNQVMASGKSLCDQGVFEVTFTGVDSLACGAKLTLKAAFGAKSKSEMAIDKNCQ